MAHAGLGPPCHAQNPRGTSTPTFQQPGRDRNAGGTNHRLLQSSCCRSAAEPLGQPRCPPPSGSAADIALPRGCPQRDAALPGTAVRRVPRRTSGFSCAPSPRVMQTDTGCCFDTPDTAYDVFSTTTRSTGREGAVAAGSAQLERKMRPAAFAVRRSDRLRRGPQQLTTAVTTGTRPGNAGTVIAHHRRPTPSNARPWRTPTDRH